MTGLTEALGSVRFVLFGVCSGADNAIATALVDGRVASIVLVDPPAYPTRRSQLRDLRTRVAERGSLREVLRWGLRVAERRLRLAIAMLGRTGAEDPPSEGREIPSAATFGDRLTTLVDRGVRVLAVFSGIHGARYNHPDQIFEVFPALRGRLDHRYYPSANHTFTELAGQAELIDDVTAWTIATAKRFG
jgi:pimeloyl-ACP methyl ester carboxylesterase